MNGREQNAAVKALIKELSGLKPKSVRQSNSGWWTIIMPQDIPNEVCRAIYKRMVDERLCGTYWPDIGPGAYDAEGKPALEPCVRIEIAEPEAA